MNFTRRDNGLNQYLAWSPMPVVYDDNWFSPWVPPGNEAMMGDGHITASYNALNQPVAMGSMSLGCNFYWYWHDPLGRCVKRWLGNGSQVPTGPITYFYYDGWNLVQEGPNASTADRLYVHGGRVDEIVASKVAGQWYHHHYDARGHCLLLTDSGGAIRDQYDYDAFGMPYFYNAAGTSLGNSSAVGNRFLFTGREWIKDLRVYDYRNRVYQPELGRFLQPDPIQFKAGDYNLYRYCHNDSVNKTDPIGLVPGDPFGSPEAAARDVPNSINPTSIKQSAEYGSVIYKVGDSFYASPSFTNGAQTHVTLGSAADDSRIPKGREVGGHSCRRLSLSRRLLEDRHQSERRLVENRACIEIRNPAKRSSIRKGLSSCWSNS